MRPLHRLGDNITCTDWARGNYRRAGLSVAGPGRVLGIEGDHLTLLQSAKLPTHLAPRATIDIAAAIMRQRMHKSPA